MPTFYGAIDLVKNEIRNVVFQNLGAAPSAPVKGQMYFNSADNTMYWWDGAQWIPAKAAAGATPAATVTTQAVGDAPVVGVSTNFAREDHKHGREAFGAATATTTYGLAKADGAAATVARSDHGHGTVGHDALDLLTAPSGPVNLNGQRLVSVADPVAFTDAATRQYVDNSVAGLAWKDSVKVATTTNGVLATAFAAGQNVDGVTLSSTDRILIKNQTSQSENGIYTVNPTGAPTRAQDSSTGAALAQATVFVESGTTQSDTAWVCTTNPPIALGTSNIVFVQFGAANSYSAGNGLTLTGNVIDVVPADTTLTVNADSMQVNTAVMATVAALNAALNGYSSKLTPTTVKTGNYTAAVGELVLVNINSNFTITLPTAPPDGSEVGVEATAGSGGNYATTIVRGGADSIAGAAISTTTVYLYGSGSSVRFRYYAAITSWLPIFSTHPFNTPLNVFGAPVNSVQGGLQRYASMGTAIAGDDGVSRNFGDGRYALQSLLTTKGDIYVATAAGTLIRVGVGPDGYALLADAAQPAGVRWGLPSPAGAAVKYSTTLTGTSSPETITHNLNTRDVHVVVYNGATPYTAVEVDWDAATVNTVTVRYNPNLGAGYRVVVMG